MEIQNLRDEIKVFYVKAASFPDGIPETHQKLRSLLPSEAGRKFFGISHGAQDDSIIYMAATEESYPGEAKKYGCETFIIKKGDYLSEALVNWKGNPSKIGKTFQKMLTDPRIDKNGYCVEKYLNETDVVCMVKLDY